ncbi:hypothetical protein HPB51_028979 [Rhipicephalus microplus]|uniref:Uncharacterized protein n=1 Tax=Rhipicephalus microplus TaxID=6941 RepID=A0A9J6CW61_RHIMP|nr:hypothetical protein HPB51_028979 [Rhipicephalus microplus]
MYVYVLAPDVLCRGAPALARPCSGNTTRVRFRHSEATGRPCKVRTAEEEAVCLEARRAAARESNRKRRSDPDYARRVREASAARKQAKQSVPGVSRAEHNYVTKGPPFYPEGPHPECQPQQKQFPERVPSAWAPSFALQFWVSCTVLIMHCRVVRDVMLPSTTFSALLPHAISIVHVMNDLCINGV